MTEHLIQADEYRPRWTNRRRVIFCSLHNDHLIMWVVLLVSCVLTVCDKMNVSIASILITFVVAAYGRSLLVIGSYVFGAVFDDKNFMNALKIKPAESEGPSFL